MFSVVCERLCETALQKNLWRPAQCIVDLAEVAVTIPDIDRLAIRRKRDQLVLTVVVQRYLCIERDKTSSQRRTNESQPAGY